MSPPRLGIGTLHFGSLVEESKAIRLIQGALELGVTFFDTSPLYGEGHAESILGKALVGHRDQCLISTKVGLQADPASDGTWGVRPSPLDGRSIRASVDASLTALGVDRIDILQLHAFDPTTPPPVTAAALQDLVSAGKIGGVACSNYSPSEFGIMSAAFDKCGLTFAFCQVHYNLLEQRAGRAFADCSVPLVCNRPLARGILGGQYHPGAPVPATSRGAHSQRIRRWLQDDTLRLVQELGAFSADRGHTIAELAIAWLLRQPAVAVALVGVRGEAQLLECVRGAMWHLSASDLRSVASLVEARGLSTQVRERPEDFLER